MSFTEKALRQRSAKSPRGNFAVALLAIVVVAVMWATVLDRIEFERVETVADAVKQNANLAIAFEEHTVRTLKGIDQTLLFIKHESEESGSKLDIRAMVADGIIEKDLFTYIGVVDEHGALTLGSGPFEPTNLGDREWFKVHQRQSSDALFIGRPLLGRVTGKWAFQMSRRIDKPDGSFGGVVYTSVDPAYFSRFYRQADLGDRGLVMLVGLDAITRARRIGQELTFGEDMRESTLFAEHAKKSAGSYVSSGRRDSVRRLMSYRSLMQYPLIVAVGTSETEALAPFYQRERNYYVGAALFTLFVVVFAAGLMVALTRQRRAIGALLDSEERYRVLTALSSDWSWEQDTEFRFVDLSRTTPSYCGISHADHIGKTRWELPNTKAINTTWEEHQALLRAHNEFRGLLLRRVDAEGKAHYVSVSGSPIVNASGTFTGYRGVASDVTERLTAEERFRATFAQAAVGIAHVAFDGRHLMVNRKYGDMLGYSQEELLLMGTDDITPRDRAGTLAELRAELLSGRVDHDSGETQFVRKDGASVWVNRTISLARDARGEPLYLIRVIEDISARKAVEIARQRSEAEFSALFNQAAVGMAQTDMSGSFLRVNEKLCTMLGYSPDELLRLNFPHITHPDDLTRDPELPRKLATGEVGGYTYEKRYLRKDGSPLWVSVTMSRVNIGPDYSTTALTVIEDISERRHAEERLTYLAQYDSLTGLPNRSLLRDRLSLAIARAKRNNQILAVLYVDLDDFSDINDSLGHACGDQVLQAAAGLLRASLREVDTVGRFGGDEFTVVLENVTGEDQVSTVAEKLKQAFADPIVIDDREIFLSPSIGIALYPHAGETVDALLQSADIAMYAAKDLGRNAYAFGSATMRAEAAERLRMSALLRRALERQEFILHYQPIVDLKTRNIVGTEALIRLDSKEAGLIPPAKFIALAEATGLIVPIGEWVLKTACAQAKAWQIPGRPPQTISVNLSARQLKRKGLVETIRQTLAETRLAPECLELEITESHLMDDGPDIIDKLAAIRRLGVGLAMDDFGTGYSSLGNLAKLPVQTLKIDRSFIAKMLDDPDTMTLVSTIVTLARSLRLKVVAEGVETDAQEKALRLLRCDEMQGYVFSRPLPAAELSALLAKHRPGVEVDAQRWRATRRS